MASGTPIIRQISWRVALPSLVIVAAAALLGAYLGGAKGLVIAMACYLAYCFGQMADIARARETYQRCLELFPNSGIALAAMRMLDAAANERASS